MDHCPTPSFDPGPHRNACRLPTTAGPADNETVLSRNGAFCRHFGLFSPTCDRSRTRLARCTADPPPGRHGSPNPTGQSSPATCGPPSTGTTRRARQSASVEPRTMHGRCPSPSMRRRSRSRLASIPRALERAMRYRLLNDPEQAESICLDILEVDPDNQEALVTLILALTDQFGVTEPPPSRGAGRASTSPGSTTEYQRHYYTGIICERRARSLASPADGARVRVRGVPRGDGRGSSRPRRSAPRTTTRRC